MVVSASRASTEDFEAVLTQNMNARAVPVACWDVPHAEGRGRIDGIVSMRQTCCPPAVPF